MRSFPEISHILGAVFIAFCTLCFYVIVRRSKSIIQIIKIENQNLKAENAKIKKKKDNATFHLKAKVKIERKKDDEILKLTADLNSCKNEKRVLQEKMLIMKTFKDLEISNLQDKVRALEIHLSRLGGYKSQSVDELIKQRRNEKRDTLQESLSNKLKNIYDRRVSGVNLKPFPEGAFQRLKANHIWEKVLGYLTEPCDLTSATFTSQTSAYLLDGKRKLLLLAEVIKVFRARADEAFEDSNLQLGNAWCQDWKLVCFNARTVCRDWKQVADFSLFDSDFCYADWFLPVDLPQLKRLCPKMNIYELNNDNSIDKISSLLANYENPSPLIRNLHVWVEPLEINQNFVTLIRLLKLYGKAVWSLQLTFNGTRTFAEIFERLTQILTCLPNLKGFKLDTDDILYPDIFQTRNNKIVCGY